MDCAEALNNADAPGVLSGAARRGMALLWAMASASGAGTEGGEHAGRAGDFARRVIVKLSSIYFTNLHTTSAVVAAAREKEATGGVQRDECPRLAKYMHHQEGVLCVLPASRKGLRETTDFVTPATSDVAASLHGNRADLRPPMIISPPFPSFPALQLKIISLSLSS